MREIYLIKKSILRRLYFLKNKYRAFGKNSLIFKPLCILGKKNIEVGNYVSIDCGARIEAISKWNSQKFNPRIFIGDNTSFEQNSHIIATGNLIIGKSCVFSSRVFITTCSHSYDEVNVNVMQQNLINNDVIIGDNCFIGMDVKIFPGVRIGNNVIIGANSIVLNDLPSYSVCVGTPARVIKRYDFNNRRWVSIKGENLDE